MRSTFALYRPGRSPLHRAPAGAKLLVLVAAGVGSAFVHAPGPALAALLVVVALYPVAGLGPRELGRQLRPLLWFVVPLAALQLWLDGWQRAVTVVAVLVALVLLAVLVTLTTRTSDLLAALVAALRPLRVVGVDPDRVGLALALGIRSVPVVVGLAGQVREAQLARGLGVSPRAFAVPLVVRTLRHADRLGDALAARGVDD